VRELRADAVLRLRAGALLAPADEALVAAGLRAAGLRAAALRAGAFVAVDLLAEDLLAEDLLADRAGRELDGDTDAASFSRSFSSDLLACCASRVSTFSAAAMSL
jgi:hypothetical protein